MSLLQKGVYLYEYMDDWKKFSEVSLPENKYFYSHLLMEHITDADYAHTKRICKDFKIIFFFLQNIMICIFKEIHYC